jgi:signal transduction histidine kinase
MNTQNTAIDQADEIQQALSDSQALALAGQFAAATMHEVNGPLEAVTNLNYLLRTNSDNSEMVRTLSQLVDEQLVILTRISRQTLSFYHSKDSRQLVVVASVAEAALRVHRHKITAKEIRLVKELPGDVALEAHPGAMLQVLSNLISNAVEALPTRGTLCLRARKSDREVHITIADDGHGIPPAISEKIFEPFFSTRKEKGTGLGLAITRELVEKHHGRIRSRSTTRSGRSGTAFRISIPLHSATSLAQE